MFCKEIWPEGLQLYENNFPTQVFSCEICEIFKNTNFEEHPQTAASESHKHTVADLKKHCAYI